MSEEKLEPCSCGGEAKVIKDVLGFWAVECKSCLTRLGVSDTKEEIIEAWNDMRRKEMSEEKLKPCPFCGSNNVELRRGFAFNGAVHCNNCTADVVFDAVGLIATGNKNWQKACIDGWNKRVVAK